MSEKSVRDRIKGIFSGAANFFKEEEEVKGDWAEAAKDSGLSEDDIKNLKAGEADFKAKIQTQPKGDINKTNIEHQKDVKEQKEAKEEKER